MHSIGLPALHGRRWVACWLVACLGVGPLLACEATLSFNRPGQDASPDTAEDARADAADSATPDAAASDGRRDGAEADQSVPPKADKGVPPKPDKGLPDQGPQPDQGPLPATNYFPASTIWYQDVSKAALASSSTTIINALNSAGGWGTGQMRIDFSLEVLKADATAPLRSFIPTADHFSPDCDTSAVPIPAGGAIEGESGYRCVSDGDCHLIVVHTPTKKLYEMWRADIVGSTFRGGCLAVWDLTKVYPADGRGEGCTSADAAGYPIAPLLFTADEVKAGKIGHALRFILPNSRIRNMVYVHPATHSTPATSGGANAIPYGARLRLKAGFNTSGLSAGAKVVAQAMKTYGMFLSDGGNIALTAQSDRFTTAKWSGLLDSYGLSSLKVTDFEVVAWPGSVINYNFNCVRN